MDHRRFNAGATVMGLLHHLLSRTISPPSKSHHLLLIQFSHQFSTSFLITKTPKKFKKKCKEKESPRTKLVQTEPNLIPHFESILTRDAHFRFLTKTKEYLSKQPQQILRLDDAGKLHQPLGFPRGRKVLKFILRHPLILQTYRHSDNKIWLGFTDFMYQLLLTESEIANRLERQRVDVVRKLLMMSANKRIPLSKIYHNRLFSLAVSALKREFLVDEDKVKRAFKLPVKHGKLLELDLEDERKLNLLNTLPLVSPYSDGSKLDMWTLEAEKYRLGVVHEFLSLTLEKRAYIHNIVEFNEEFSLTKHTYQMLLKQARTFYLAGTEMNWCVFFERWLRWRWRAC
ncbi:hypothetical protein ABFS83_05G074000 [Erythranthe nasuta]